MTTRFVFHAAAGALTVTLGCGSSGGGDGARGPGQAFAPDTIEYEHVATNFGFQTPPTNDLKLVAATFDENIVPSLWLFAVQNVGQQFICSPTVGAEFLDGNNQPLRSGGFLIITPMYGSGPLQWCLPPGEIGFGSGMPPRGVNGVPPTRRILYSFHGIAQAGEMRDTTVAIDEVAFENTSPTRTTVKASVHNHGTTTVTTQLHFFPTNPAGRPLTMARSLSEDIQPETTWPIAVWVNVPVDTYAAFVSYGN